MYGFVGLMRRDPLKLLVIQILEVGSGWRIVLMPGIGLHVRYLEISLVSLKFSIRKSIWGDQG